MDLTENPNGTNGELYESGPNGRLIRRGVEYEVWVYATWSELPRGQRVRAQDEIEAKIDLTAAEAHKFVGATLTLHLEDGRWLDLIIMSSHGRVVPAGAIRERR